MRWRKQWLLWRTKASWRVSTRGLPKMKWVVAPASEGVFERPMKALHGVLKDYAPEEPRRVHIDVPVKSKTKVNVKYHITNKRKAPDSLPEDVRDDRVVESTPLRYWLKAHAIVKCRLGFPVFDAVICNCQV